MGYYIRQIADDNYMEQRKVDELLQAEGIHRDANLDYTCGLFDGNEQLVATGSCFGNTIRCLAVSSKHRGEGLLNQIVGHLMEVQVYRGNAHLFLYTKCDSAKFLADLGFYEIARVDGQLVFMENRRNGFSEYCRALEKKYIDGKRIASIVMNANPFTLGHRYLVERAAKENDVVHLFILSQDAGPIPFAVRRRLVQEGIKDIGNVVLHDSGPYIISTATFPSYFFPDSDAAIRAQAALDLIVFSKIAASLGIQRRYVGEERSSHVTMLYNEIMAKKLPENGIECCVIPRIQAAGRTVSASVVRKAIHDGKLESVRDMLPESTYRYFASDESEDVRRAICREKNVVHY